MTNKETIYRQDVLDLAKKGVLISNGNYESVCKAINEIPSVNPQPCEDAISRQAVEDKLLKLCNELEGIFADIRMKEVDDCVCGLCEYDCDHGIDGSAFECPGFETDECFKLADKIRHEWQSTKDLPPVTPQSKTGHWEQYGNSWEDKFKCSECGKEQPKILCGERIIGHWSDYCPNCGCRMVEPQERSEKE